LGEIDALLLRTVGEGALGDGRTPVFAVLAHVDLVVFDPSVLTALARNVDKTSANSALPATTAISVLGMKSPHTASTIQTSTAGVFEAWSGFPAKDKIPAREIVLPRKALAPSEIPLPLSAKSPLPTSPSTPRTAPILLAPPITSPRSTTHSTLCSRQSRPPGLRVWSPAGSRT
jgi:hypothetical protein